MTAGPYQPASVWYEQNGFTSDAIRHALAAADFARAEGRSNRPGRQWTLSYQSATWLGWARALPDATIRNRPVLSVGYAWALLDGGEFRQVKPICMMPNVGWMRPWSR